MTAIIWTGILLLVAIVIDKLVKRYRRKKYPKYFELCDSAMKAKYTAAAAADTEIAYLENRVRFLAEGFMAGECTKAYIEEQFGLLLDRYIKAVKLYEDKCANANETLKDADKYAKENNLTWGILYK